MNEKLEEKYKELLIENSNLKNSIKNLEEDNKKLTNDRDNAINIKSSAHAAGYIQAECQLPPHENENDAINEIQQIKRDNKILKFNYQLLKKIVSSLAKCDRHPADLISWASNTMKRIQEEEEQKIKGQDNGEEK